MLGLPCRPPGRWLRATGGLQVENRWYTHHSWFG